MIHEFTGACPQTVLWRTVRLAPGLGRGAPTSGELLGDTGRGVRVGVGSVLLLSLVFLPRGARSKRQPSHTAKSKGKWLSWANLYCTLGD